MVVSEEGAVGPAPAPAPHNANASAAPHSANATAHTNGTSPKHGAISSNIHNIMGGMESTEGVKLHNHRRKLRQRFDIVRKLGQGTYGKVQLGINKETGQEVAIKTIKKAKIETEADLIRIRREIQIMSSVRHPNIIHIYEVFENREKMVLVMEYAAGGELYDYLSERKVLAEQEARRIFRQIATAAYYCHKHKICHRDLKLENILLDETGNAKIADFGLSNVFDEQRLLSTFCGSPLYASPEIVKGTPYHGPEVDCWSLGVLLYTLVYGAMPFDGSNFKKLVKQISQGDYFEPKKPSPASPLIRDMLTVTPRKRADIEKICSHWWVNETYPENCLDVAENLANQTPVRLDLLLSLAPAPSSEKLVVTETKTEETTPVSALPPSNFPRSQSAGSLMELDYPSRKSPPRLPKPPPPPVETAPKRKLQECPSGETGAKRKESEPVVEPTTEKCEEVKRKEENMEVDEQEKPVKTIKEKRKSIKSKKESTKVDKPSEEIPSSIPPVVPNKQEPETQQNNTEDKTKVKRKKKIESKSSENVSEPKVVETKPSENNIENTEIVAPIVQEIVLIPESVVAINESKDTPIVADSNTEAPVVVLEEEKPKEEALSLPETVEKVEVKESTPNEAVKKEESPKVESPVKKRPQSFKIRTKTEELPSPSPEKSVESPKTDVRRRSSIFEKAEKFNSMSTSNIDSNKPSPEKPKKLFIPGVKISDFKKAFETKKAPTKSASTSKATEEIKKSETPIAKSKTTKSESPKVEKKETVPKLISPLVPSGKQAQPEEAQIKKINNNNNNEIKAKTPEKIESPKPKSKSPFKEIPPKAPSPIKSPEIPVENDTKPTEAKKKSTTMKIVLESSPKSATLPRRTSKAEIRLNTPPQKPPEYRTEVEHMVGTPPGQNVIPTQRSEVAFPVSAPSPRQPRPYKHSNTAPTANAFRSTSLEPDMSRVKERIIPIRLEADEDKPPVHPTPVKPIPIRRDNGESPVKPTSVRESPVRPIPVRRESRESLSRQSTVESEPETIRGEPIRKSPREFIIPIAVEGGGYVTPRATSLEPTSETSTPTRTRAPRLSRPMGSLGRMGLLSETGDFEDNGIAAPSSLHRMTSMQSDHGEQGDEVPPAGGPATLGRGLHMHRLRSSRPTRQSVEHNDSFSSGEEDDEDDGFEILTAESLFSTLLSRVRSLTQRLNVEDSMRPGFGSSRLLGHTMPPFSNHPHSLFSNFHGRMGEPLTRRLSEHSRLGRTSSRGEEPAWRRSVSRDASDAGDSLYSDHQARGEVGGSAGDYYPHQPRRVHQQQHYQDTYMNPQQAYRRTISADMSRRQATEPDIYRQNYYNRPEQDTANLYGTLRQQRPVNRNRSMSLNRESKNKQRMMPPENSVLSKFLAQDLREMSPPNPPPLTHEERRRGRRVSRFLRPDFFDTPREESVYVRQKEDEDRMRRERQSMERRQNEEGHVNRAISSLQQRTNSQDFTESTLIKRAVSSDDCAQYNEQPPRGKVNSVLGMFKKMENTPDKNAISRFRRAQSVYDASSSDSSIQNDNLRRKPTGILKNDPQRQSTFLPYGQRTPSEEKSIDGDYEDEYSQGTSSRRHDSSSAGGQDDSFDSWSVCSDTLEPLEDETVSDRIRRKSFYTRFNDYVAPKKPQSNKASPAVAAILERDIPRRSSHKHRHRESSEHGKRDSSHEHGSRHHSRSRLNDEVHREAEQIPSGRHHSRSRINEENSPAEQARHRKYNVYASLPRGWEPQAETEYYQQARKLNRYAHHQHTSVPLFPPSRRPGPPSPPPLGVEL